MQSNVFDIVVRVTKIYSQRKKSTYTLYIDTLYVDFSPGNFSQIARDVIALIKAVTVKNV